MLKIDLSGTNVLVTGASRGIGKAIAESLGQAGARVGIHYKSNKEKALALAKEIGNGSLVFPADLANPGDCLTFFDEAAKEMGGIDVLINNAGIAIESPVSRPNCEWLDDWEDTINVNLTALALLSKIAVEHFIPRGGGRIINISSRAAFRGDTTDYLAYAASKGGVVSLTRSIARGFGKQNVKAFLIAPGFVRTDMAQDFFELYGEEKILEEISLPKLTEPSDVAPLIAFIAAGMADHASGGTFDINAASYVH